MRSRCSIPRMPTVPSMRSPQAVTPSMPRSITMSPARFTCFVAANSWGPEARFRFESYTTPTTLYADAGDGKPLPLKSLPARFDASSLRTEQFFATSKDGTRVPYFVTLGKAPAGPVPTVLYGYGGFEISMAPNYSPDRKSTRLNSSHQITSYAVVCLKTKINV